MKTVYMVYSNPAEGREEEYNDWYSSVHLQEVVRVEGFISAQRFELTKSQLIEEQHYKYMAIYEIENEDVPGTTDRLIAASANMNMSTAIDIDDIHVAIFKSTTGIIK
jgi:hypothetical protein